MNKKLLLGVVLLAIAGAGMAFAQQAKTYYMEIWNISTSTFNTLQSDYGEGNRNGYVSEDAYYFIRAASGTTSRSKDKGLSFEQVRQKMLGVDADPRAFSPEYLQRLQQRGQYSFWSSKTGQGAYQVFIWMRAEN